MSSFAVNEQGSLLTQSIDNSGGSTGLLPLYIGETAPGTAKTAAFWRIKKLTYDGNNNVTDVQWAQGDKSFSYVWNNRTTYAYS